MNQDQLKNNVKELIEELMTLFTSLPKKSIFKLELAQIVSAIRYNAPLKNIIIIINNKIKETATPNTEDKTLRKYHEKFWKYVLDIFISRLKEAQK